VKGALEWVPCSNVEVLNDIKERLSSLEEDRQTLKEELSSSKEKQQTLTATIEQHEKQSEQIQHKQSEERRARIQFHAVLRLNLKRASDGLASGSLAEVSKPIENLMDASKAYIERG